MRFFIFLALFFLSLTASAPVYAAEPVPSAHCLSSNPCVPTSTPTETNTTAPSGTSGVAQPNSSVSLAPLTNPSPTSAIIPCATTQSAAESQTSSYHDKHHAPTQQGDLQQLIQLLLQLLQLLFQQLGIQIPVTNPCGTGTSPLPTTSPTTTVIQQPSTIPTSGGGQTPSSAPTINPTPTIFGTTPSPSPTVAAPSPTSPASNVQPVGISGNWSLVFDDEFNGSSLDTSKWAAVADGGESMENNVAVSASNVSVSGGNLILTLSSSSLGANVTSDPNEVGNGKGFQFGDGYYLEGRIYFPGAAANNLYNWPAFWTSGHNWPASGEIDIAEVGNGPLTTSYHCSSGSGSDCGTASPGGSWGNAYHVYGVDRESGTNTVYWDGKQVAKFTSSDGGANEYFLINVGNSTGPQCNCGGPSVFGTGSQVKIDYVRAWKKN